MSSDDVLRAVAVRTMAGPCATSPEQTAQRLSSASWTASWSPANQLAQLQASPEREWLKGKGEEQQDKAISCPRWAFHVSLCLEHHCATKSHANQCSVLLQTQKYRAGYSIHWWFTTRSNMQPTWHNSGSCHQETGEGRGTWHLRVTGTTRGERGVGHRPAEHPQGTRASSGSAEVLNCWESGKLKLPQSWMLPLYTHNVLGVI